MSHVPDHYGVKLPEGVIPPESYEDAAAFFEWDPKLLVGEKPLPLGTPPHRNQGP